VLWDHPGVPPREGTGRPDPAESDQVEDGGEGEPSAVDSTAAARRALLFVLGLAAIVATIVIWLVPPSNSTTTVSERSTTSVIGGTGGWQTTAIHKTTTTRAPGAGRSDAVLIAIFTFGVGLVLVAALWDRIHSLAIGGVSITLTDAAVATGEIALVDAVAAHMDSPTSTAVDMLTEQVDSVAKRGLGLVRVDLRNGDLWAPLNLCLFVLLLAHRTSAEVIVFTGTGQPGPDTYFGAASVPRLADKLAADDPALANAHRATETIPLTHVERPAGVQSVGTTFFAVLQEFAPQRVQEVSSERVDEERLLTLAGRALVTASVQSEPGATLSRQQQRAILAFPLAYVPITNQRKLDQIVDKGLLAYRIARVAVGS
jgi:hypothetical protein